MAFFLVEGFRSSTNVSKYMGRLLVFALIAQIPYTFAFGVYSLNIIFNILLGLIVLLIHDELCVESRKPAGFVAMFLLILLLSEALVESGAFGVITIFMIYRIKGEKKRVIIPLLLLGTYELLVLVIIQAAIPFGLLDVNAQLLEFALMQHYYVFSLGPFIVIPLLLSYNHQRGRRAKYLFYSFYPSHLFVLAGIAFALASLS